MNCLRIGPPAGDRSSARMTGLPTRIIAAGGCAGSTAVAPCPVTVTAYARDQPGNRTGARDEPAAAAHSHLAALRRARPPLRAAVPIAQNDALRAMAGLQVDPGPSDTDRRFVANPRAYGW